MTLVRWRRLCRQGRRCHFHRRCHSHVEEVVHGHKCDSPSRMGPGERRQLPGVAGLGAAPVLHRGEGRVPGCHDGGGPPRRFLRGPDRRPGLGRLGPPQPPLHKRGRAPSAGPGRAHRAHQRPGPDRGPDHRPEPGRHGPGPDEPPHSGDGGPVDRQVHHRGRRGAGGCHRRHLYAVPGGTRGLGPPRRPLQSRAGLIGALWVRESGSGWGRGPHPQAGPGQPAPVRGSPTQRWGRGGLAAGQRPGGRACGPGGLGSAPSADGGPPGTPASWGRATIPWRPGCGAPSASPRDATSAKR